MEVFRSRTRRPSEAETAAVRGYSRRSIWPPSQADTKMSATPMTLAHLKSASGSRRIRDLRCSRPALRQDRRSRARTRSRRFGYATLAIDAPGHGDRISRQEAASLMRDVGARVRGESPAGFTPERMRQMGERSRLAIAEWKAALDAVQALDFVGAGGPVGYWGVSMGTAIGVPFVASEPRINCAVFGLAGLREGAADMAEAAARIAIPVEFVFQWEDAVAPREAGLAVFNAFASAEKTMHINPGGHMDIPDFEGASWERFFLRHLGTAVPAKQSVAA